MPRAKAAVKRSTPLASPPQAEIVVIEPIAVRRSTAARMLDCGPTSIYELCKAGKLETIRLGADTRVTVASIRRYAENNLTAAAVQDPMKS